MLDPYRELIGGLPEWAQQSVTAAIIVVFAVAVALMIHAIVFRVLRRLAGASSSKSDNILVSRITRPTRWALIALALVVAARETPALDRIWERLGGLVMPLMVGWMALAILHALVETAILRSDISMDDNRRNRRKRTRISIFGRIASFAIVFVTVGLMLLSIPGVRDIGVTLVASAGLAGLAVGAAAQPALKSLIAGFQMAITEPVVIGDAVIIGGEWGYIEEIRMTYVVVKVWDERRLVVPTQKFLDEIFQNWTKTTSQLMGTVMLYLDPMAELEPFREKFYELIESNERWDRRVKHMQVIELTRDAVEVRFLMTAKDSPTLFDLRCDIREALIGWIRETRPEAIVRNRIMPVSAVELSATPSMAELIGERGDTAERARAANG
jgi:small-conductance mechanosensitive channel